MSIFLRGVDMPECCCGCPCCYEKADGSCFCTAVKDGEPCDIEDLDQRLPNCPAEDVSEPHGDLIDRDYLLNSTKVLFNDVVVNQWSVINAPTIIKAEG
ncbi:hypothetical protein [Ruminococcus sp.]|uniref:hypothetical protein n=1 Tax=Ruminococcus sp. TaxID=41978 RepID=UPI0038638CD1